MAKSVSGHQLAKMLGVSESGVRAAIRDGRIRRLPNGKIDPDEARAAWEANTDPARSKVRTSSKVRDQGAQKARGVQEPSAPSEPSPFQLHRTDKEAWTAQLRRLEFERKAGRLIDREAAERQVFQLARNARDAWLNWPARVAAIAAEEIQIDRATGRADARSVAIILERLVREHCAEMGEPEKLNLRIDP